MSTALKPNSAKIENIRAEDKFPSQGHVGRCANAARDEEISGASDPSAAMMPSSDSDKRSHCPNYSIRLESMALEMTVRIRLPTNRKAASVFDIRLDP